MTGIKTMAETLRETQMRGPDSFQMLLDFISQVFIASVFIIYVHSGSCSVTNATRNH